LRLKVPLKVYIETTIPSAYHETRRDTDSVFRRNHTRGWWDRHAVHFELVTSEAVLQELRSPGYPAAKRTACLALLESVSLVPITDSVIEAAEIYAREFVMPSPPSLDAIHLALASCHGCDILLTWNCDHLANANKLGHIRIVNRRLRLTVPLLITPLQLMTGET
jgi:predicted nucleic acid-binding protein